MILVTAPADSVFANIGEHISIFCGGALVISALGHAVDTFPPPASALGKWALGVIQYIVGQRLKGLQTIKDPKDQNQ